MKVQGTIDDNFWSMNPELKVPEKLGEFHKKDKSLNKKDSSKIMWAIYMLTHKDSIYNDLPIREKRELITRDFLREPKFDWSKLKDVIKAFEDTTLTVLGKQVMEFKRLLDERAEYMKTVKFNLSTRKDITEMMLETNKLAKEYDFLVSRLNLESDEGEIKGGEMESLNDKGLI